MELLCVIFLILNCGASQLKGLAAVVQTQLDVFAAEGEDAPLGCQLLETKDVQQVTWQKVFGRKERNICFYSEYFGQTVIPDFKDKVQFTEAGLKNSSIVIRKVTEKDEGCYLCLFNIYPDGPLIGRTCLNVYELHEPVLDVSRSESPAELVVSCSATGRPAPTVTLTVLQQNLSFSHYNSSSVTHSNGTVTVTTTALLSASSSTQVGCSVSVLSAAPREKLITVPGVKETSFEGLIFGVLVFGVLVALLATFYLRQMHQNRKPQMEKNSEDQISIIKNEEMLQPQKNTEEPTSVIIYRQSSRQSPTTESPTKLPTTPDVESCPPEPHTKVAPKKSI